MVVRRNLYLAWLALALSVAAPVLAYTHIHIGANGEIIEHCAAEEPGDTDAQRDHSQSGKATVPHCPYCAGFLAGVALGAHPILTVPHQATNALIALESAPILPGPLPSSYQARAPPVAG